MQQHPKSMAVCVIVGPDQQVSLMCAVSMLRMQMLVMTLPEPMRTLMHFVRSFDEALNVLHASDAVGAFVVQGSMGFETDFPVTCICNDLSVVACTYPLPRVDWERVKSMPIGGEPPEFWGNSYNVTPLEPVAGKDFVRVDPQTAQLGAVWVAKRVVEDIARRRPDLVSADGKVASFGAPGVYEGRALNEYQRFLSLYGGEVWTDLQRQATSSGLTEFGGSVGARTVLR